jgi:signal transduction histidine kinase/CheY-like chemotaxis protein
VWPDGSEHHIQGLGRVARDADGRALRMVGVNWDVTERVAAAEMRAARDRADRASRAKSDFLATMSHEIRSPLSALIGVLDLLRSTELDAEQGRMATMMHSSAHMLLAVLNDVLDFSKIEAGALSVTLQPVALRPVLAELVQPYVVSAERKGLALTLSVAEDVPAAIESDDVRLRQILGNLLSNALKFTASGGIELAVRPVRDAAEPSLCFTVRDTGIGMTAEVIALLFQPFVQADASTTRLYGGTGLGLSISQRLARLLCGDLSVSSIPGEGSEFSLVLPMRVCVAAETAIAKATPQIAFSLAEIDLRALVVDDDSTIRWLSQRQLEKLGFIVETATDGAEGWQKLLTAGYDLLLTDCHMPRMDGVALTRAVRSAEQASLRELPIIGVTADVTDKQRMLCVEAGMSDIAIKPLTIERLAWLVRRHFRCAEGAAADGRPSANPAASSLRAIPFDDQIFLSIFSPGDPEGAAWLEEFLAAAECDCAELAQMAEDCMAVPCVMENLARCAHRLAGAAFSVGATLLGDAARALEQAAAQGDLARVQCCTTILHAAHARAAEAIGEFCRKGKEGLLF